MIQTFTLENLINIALPNLKQDKADLFFAPLVEAMNQYNITTVKRISCFLGQALHESNCFNVLAENLNYSASRLVAVFPRYFPTLEIAKQYERKPDKIANRAYANRGGNGNELSGDGYKYRGRGIFQLTLKDNYVSLSRDTKIDFISNPDLLLEAKYACISACWFFNKNGLNEIADLVNDANDEAFKKLTKRVNTGMLGLDERKKYCNRALTILK